MIRSLMQIALKGRAVIIGLAIALLLSGIYAFSQIDIEAYPDPVQPMIELLTLPTGLSAEEVERLVTVPLEYTLSTTRNLEAMRSISLFGLSDIRCYFSWDSDYYWDNAETINQLQFVSLPTGITAGISPENAIGEIYRYTVESPDHDLLNEKTVNDWIVSRQLSTVPGVIGDSTFGGLTKQYHVDVDPQKLDYYHVPLSALTSALTNANISSGGNYLDVGEQAFDVRGLGFIESLDDIRNTVLSVSKSTPITVGNVAEVSVGYAPRLGIVGMNNRDEMSEGIVLMRKYGNTLKTLRGVEAKVKRAQRLGDVAARPPHRAVLRSHLAGPDHSAHGAGEPDPRDGAGVPGADLFPGQSEGGDNRRDQYPAGVVRRVYPDAGERDASQPDFARRDRLRHHHRHHRDRDGEHQPPSQLGRVRARITAADESCAPRRRSAGRCSFRL